MAKRYTLISGIGDKIVLPVPPQTYSERAEQNIRTFETLNGGEIAVVGSPKLKVLSFAGLLPNKLYPFVREPHPPAKEIKAKIEKWRDSKENIRVVISGSGINHMYAIRNFICEEKDESGDIYFQMELLEHKSLNVPAAKNTAPIHPITMIKVRPQSPNIGAARAYSGAVKTAAVAEQEAAKKIQKGKDAWVTVNQTFKAVTETFKPMVDSVISVFTREDTNEVDARGLNAGLGIRASFARSGADVSTLRGGAGGGKGSF